MATSTTDARFNSYQVVDEATAEKHRDDKAFANASPYTDGRVLTIKGFNLTHPSYEEKGQIKVNKDRIVPCVIFEEIPPVSIRSMMTDKLDHENKVVSHDGELNSKIKNKMISDPDISVGNLTAWFASELNGKKVKIRLTPFVRTGQFGNFPANIVNFDFAK